MNLYLDIETTGLVPKGLNWEKDYNQFPHIVSIAWKLNGIEKEYIIHQEGREIPLEVSAIHGITTEMANDPAKTKSFEDVMTEFLMDSLQATKMIGHNIYFDSSIIKASVLRKYGEHSPESATVKLILDKDRRIDTMKRGIPLNEGRWPKLTVLYKILFNEEYPAHNALADVNATERVHNKLIEMNL